MKRKEKNPITIRGEVNIIKWLTSLCEKHKIGYSYVDIEVNPGRDINSKPIENEEKE